MSERIVSGMSLTLLVTGMLISAFSVRLVNAESTTLIVPDDYSTIQEAIDNAHSGDTIYVKNGIYYENLVVNKQNLTLTGENRNITVIHGSHFAVSLQADNITVTGFRVMNGTIGVQMSPWTHGHLISDTILTNNDVGISGHYDVYNITISSNKIAMNNFAGIHMVFHNSVISDNLISNNGKGDFIGLTAGILVGAGVNNETISSNDNMIIRNTIEANYNGILITSYSEGNIFHHNTFWNNTRQILLSSSNATVKENFWSDYTGEDKNGDGIGDTAYVITDDVEDSFPLMSPFSYWINPIDGDVNKNMKVDIFDVAVIAKAFGSYPGHERWNPVTDINQDSKVDIKDIALTASNFGKTYS